MLQLSQGWRNVFYNLPTEEVPASAAYSVRNTNTVTPPSNFITPAVEFASTAT